MSRDDLCEEFLYHKSKLPKYHVFCSGLSLHGGFGFPAPHGKWKWSCFYGPLCRLNIYVLYCENWPALCSFLQGVSIACYAEPCIS